MKGNAFGKEDKVYWKIPNAILEPLYNFYPKVDQKKKLSVNELKFLVYLCRYTNNIHKPIEFKRNELIKELYSFNDKRTIDNKTLTSIFRKFGVIKLENGNYSKKLDENFIVNIKKDSLIKNGYSKLPIKVWEEISNHNELNLYKLLFFVLFSNSFLRNNKFHKFKYKEFYDILDIKYHRSNHKYLKDSMQYYFTILYNLNMISDFVLDSKGILFFTNPSFKENKEEKPEIKPTKKEKIIKEVVEKTNTFIPDHNYFNDKVEDTEFEINLRIDDISNL